jgi:hypothetical protein
MNFVILNEEGMKGMKSIFPDGKVPVMEMTPHNAELEGMPGPAQVYKMNIKAMGEEKYHKCLTAMAEKFGEDIEVIKEDIEQKGYIPLNAQLVSVSAGELRQFI